MQKTIIEAIATGQYDDAIRDAMEEYPAAPDTVADYVQWVAEGDHEGQVSTESDVVDAIDQRVQKMNAPRHAPEHLATLSRLECLEGDYYNAWWKATGVYWTAPAGDAK